MTNGIRVREFNKYFNAGTARFRRFPGATAKSILHYVLPTLLEESPEIAVIHLGGNDLPTTKSNSTPVENIAKTIIEIGTLCYNYNVKRILICGIITRKGGYMEKRRAELNNLLKNMCIVQGFKFIDNDNIKRYLLARDKVHLNEQGKIYLANNILHSLNSIF